MGKHLLFVVVCTLSASAWGEQAAPFPPSENPHPPATQAEHRAVAFAEDVVKRFLTTPAKLPQPGAPAVAYKDKDAACLASDACWSADAAFVADLAQFYSGLGALVETKHVHVVPSSAKKLPDDPAPKKAKMKPTPTAEQMMPIGDDEVAVHLYGKAKNGVWHHVSIVLSANGALRRILTVPMQSAHKLPPGAKC